MEIGILDKTRLTANVLMLLLVCLNIFFSTQYTQNYLREKEREIQEKAKTEERIQTSRFMKFFVDKVLGTNGTVSFEDRVKLEADIRALNKPELTKQWEAFVASQDVTEAQANAVKLMSMLSGLMI